MYFPLLHLIEPEEQPRPKQANQLFVPKQNTKN